MPSRAASSGKKGISLPAPMKNPCQQIRKAHLTTSTSDEEELGPWGQRRSISDQQSAALQVMASTDRHAVLMQSNYKMYAPPPSPDDGASPCCILPRHGHQK